MIAPKPNIIESIKLRISIYIYKHSLAKYSQHRTSISISHRQLCRPNRIFTVELRIRIRKKRITASRFSEQSRKTRLLTAATDLLFGCSFLYCSLNSDLKQLKTIKSLQSQTNLNPITITETDSKR